MVDPHVSAEISEQTTNQLSLNEAAPRYDTKGNMLSDGNAQLCLGWEAGPPSLCLHYHN